MNFNELLFKGTFFKNTAILTAGTTVAQIIPLIIYPLLTRIYTPEQFGVYALFTSVVNVISVILTGRYECAIMLAKDKKQAANVFALSLLLGGIICTCMMIPIYIWNSYFNDLFGSSALGKLLVLSPLCAFFIGVFNTYNEWCVRNNYFVKLSLNKITNSFSLTSVKLILIYTLLKNNGLIFGDLIGRGITAIACFVRIIKKDLECIGSINYKDIIHSLFFFKDFPLYNLPAQLLNTLGASVPVILLGKYYSTIEVGYFNMTMCILMVPINMISLSIRDVFRQKANEIFIQGGSFFTQFLVALKTLTIISVIGAISVVYFVPDIFSFVLGKTWYTSGIYAQLLLPMIVLDFIAMSLSGVLIVLNKLKQNLYWQIYYVGISIISIYVGVSICNDMFNVIILFSAARFSAYFLLIVLVYYYSKRTSYDIKK